jgi:transcriptional regulator with XRE-family HTH domain
VQKLKNNEMPVEDAIIILTKPKSANKAVWGKYKTPYDTAVNTLKKYPEHEHILKEHGLPIDTIASAFLEAGKIGLARNARFNEDREARRAIIADRIKQVRQMNKLTQEQISRTIDWNTLTYRGYENCKSDVPMVILIRLADYYNVPLDYLTGRTDNILGQSANSAELEQRIAKLESMVETLSKT